jgi:MinD superfamily P-loop ATPase
LEITSLKELVVISGKGGTGKTSIMAALASLAEKKVLCDADVDAADLHLIAAPKVLMQTDFQAGHTAQINKSKCTGCGLCMDLCRWQAINENFKVDPIGCEGCGVCVHFCPEKAIDFPENTCGKWFVSDTRLGPMVHARLGVAEENSGKLVTLVRQEAAKLGKQRNLGLILTDGPPGVGCPVIASIGGASAILIISEPTIAGRHDMERVVQLAEHFKVPAMMCINKYDLNLDMTRELEIFAEQKKISCLGKIAFDQEFTKAMIQAQTIFEYNENSGVASALKKIWKNVCRQIEL